MSTLELQIIGGAAVLPILVLCVAAYIRQSSNFRLRPSMDTIILVWMAAFTITSLAFYFVWNVMRRDGFSIFPIAGAVLVNLVILGGAVFWFERSDSNQTHDH